METKGELDIEELQQWQRDILDTKDYLDNWLSMETWERDKEIPLTITQANMLEKVIGDDFFITDKGVREILEAVWECGFYYERDRKILNWARDCYLEGKNWIKEDNIV